MPRISQEELAKLNYTINQQATQAYQQASLYISAFAAVFVLIVYALVLQFLCKKFDIKDKTLKTAFKVSAITAITGFIFSLVPAGFIVALILNFFVLQKLYKLERNQALQLYIVAGIVLLILVLVFIFIFAAAMSYSSAASVV